MPKQRRQSIASWLQSGVCVCVCKHGNETRLTYSWADRSEMCLPLLQGRAV